MKQRDPNNYYKNKYRIKLLQNRKLYSYTKECIDMLERMGNKYHSSLKNKLNLIANDKNENYNDKGES